MRSNGWDNDSAALQLFSHVEGDALNVAHLVPLARRLSQSGLVDALTAHYGSPGRPTSNNRGRSGEFFNSLRNAGCEGFWGYGTDSLTTANSGQIYSWPQ